VRYWKRWLVCFRKASWGSYEHGGLGYAKGAAYSALLAFFPILTTVTTLLVQANAAAVSRRIVAFIFQAAPPGIEDLIRYQMAERGAKPMTLPLIAGLLSIWAASGVTSSLLEAFQAAYGGPHGRGAVRQRLIAIWLVVAAILPVVGVSAMMLFGLKAETWLFQQLGFRVLSYALNVLLGFVAMVAAAGMLFYFGPVGPKGRKIWPGAWLAASLWLLLTILFTWYVRYIANYNVLYGSIGAVMALMVWLWLLSLAAMVGCEFNAHLDGHRARTAKPRAAG
jgi:membrane protein